MANPRKRAVRGAPANSPNPAPPPPTPSPASRRRQAEQISPMINVDEIEDEDSNEEDNVAVTITTPAARPAAKKLKTIPRSNDAPACLLSIKWVHPDVQADVLNLNHTGGSVNGCMNFYIRAATWITRDISANERVNFVVGAFGVPKKDASKVDSEGIGSSKSPEMFGLTILQHFKGYLNNLLARIRINFDALLQMFLNSEDSAIFLQAHLGIWDMKKKLEATRTAKRGTEVPVINIRSIQPTVSIMDEESVNDIFIKGDMKLVSDVWFPIMDVVEEDFLLKDAEWGGKFLKSTCITLGWLITYYFNSADPREFIGKENAGSAIDTADKTAALLKGELPFTGWPQIRKPVKWGPKMGKCTHYGALVGSRVVEELAKENLEHDIIAECNKPDSVSKLCDPPAAAQDILEISAIEDQAIYIQKNLKARCSALTTMAREAKERKNKLLALVKSNEVWMKESATLTYQTLKRDTEDSTVERLCLEARRLFTEKENIEREHKTEGIALPTNWINFLDVLVGFEAWVENLHQTGYFTKVSANTNQGRLGQIAMTPIPCESEASEVSSQDAM